MILRLSPKVLENRLAPKPLHQIPVIDLPVLDRRRHIVRLGICNSLISDEVVQIIDPSFTGKVTGFVGDGWTSGGGVTRGRGSVGCDGRGENERGFGISGETL
jgi:hypothetical protein